MKIAYIAHKIGGDVTNNLKKIDVIVRDINLTYPDVVPFVPYYADIIAMDDAVPAERERGIKNDSELFKRKVMDEVWLYGDKISNGMWNEIKQAEQYDIPIVPKTYETTKEYFEYLKTKTKETFS